MRRVVMTGLGPVTSIGVGAKAFHKAQLEGRSGVQRITRFEVGKLPSQIAGEVDVELDKWLTPLEIRWTDRFTQLAMVAAELALVDSGLEPQIDPSCIGVIIGSGVGGLGTVEQQSKARWEKGAHRLSAMSVPMYMPNTASSQVAIKHNLMGVNGSVSTACSTGADAIGLAYRSIACGEADVMLAGGSEAPINPIGVGGFTALRALSTRNDTPHKASRPFSKSRDGFIIAEGAGVVVLEELEHAKARSANIYAEILGFGRSSDAYHITKPHPEGKGAVIAIKKAIEEAKLSHDKVDYINAHGTSTLHNDLIETLAIKKVFASHAYKLVVSATKSMIGHSLGGAGAIEAIASVQALYSSIVPPTINYDPDPELDLDYVPQQAREKNLEIVISNSFAFGGQNTVLLFGKI